MKDILQESPQCSEHPGLFSEVLSAISTGIIILDIEEESVCFRNAYANSILDQVRANSAYPDIYDLLKDEIAKLQGGEHERSQKKKIRYGDRLFGYTLYGSAVSTRYLAVFIQDITDQLRLEAIDEASEMMHNIGFLFSGIRHEIGNPINSIKMALTVLRKNINRFPVDEVEKYFDRIFGEVAKMEVLLKSLKTFNLFEKPRPTAIDLKAFFDEFIRLFSMDARKKNVKVDIEISQEARWVNADMRAMQHVIMNIFANAMDALEGRPDPHLVVRCQPGGKVVVLTISDNGCGIDAQVKGDIFKPFFTTKKDGTGLGLMLSRKLLTQMNCSLEISSKYGTGTTVTLLLPNATVNDPTVKGLPIDH